MATVLGFITQRSVDRNHAPLNMGTTMLATTPATPKILANSKYAHETGRDREKSARPHDVAAALGVRILGKSAKGAFLERGIAPVLTCGFLMIHGELLMRGFTFSSAMQFLEGKRVWLFVRLSD